jgi:hypothetical protein
MPAVDRFKSGELTGHFTAVHDAAQATTWSGAFDFSGATLAIPAINMPLTEAAGHVTFGDATFDLQHFSAELNKMPISGSYHYNAALKHPERARLEVATLDLAGMEHLLDPMLQPQDLLTRLRVTKRSLPPWLAERNLNGELTVGQFSIGDKPIGKLSAKFLWQAANIQLTSVQIQLPEGVLSGRGDVNFASYNPLYQFQATVNGFPWRGGTLAAVGAFESAGSGADILQNLSAHGMFTGEQLALSTDDEFDTVAGQFSFSFSEGWPDLRLTSVQATDGDDSWIGDAASQRDGKLIFELEHAGRQRRVVSSLTPEQVTATVSSLR